MVNQMTEENPNLSKVTIEFAAPGSAHFRMLYEGVVSPEQMSALAGQLKLMFDHEILSTHVARLEKLSQQKLAVPKQEGIILPNQ